MKKVTIDFETRSEIDLRKQGLAVYAAHESTDILCMAWTIEDEEINLWLPGEPAPFDPTYYKVHAHNAAFEYAIWNQVATKRYGWATLPLENLVCNMAMGLAMGLPGKLEKLAIALNLDHQKDMKGSRVMLQLSKPRSVKNGKVTWWEKSEVPEKYQTTYEYCKKDVEVERASAKKLKELSEFERKLWLLDQRVNLRGIKVDLEAVNKAEAIIAEEKAELDEKMRELTNGQVKSCSAAAQITSYIKSFGVELSGVTKAEVLSLLDSSSTPAHIKEVLKLRQEAAKSSTAKLTAMKLRASADGRVRNTLQYYAAHTGRWGGRGIQLQNLPRPSISQAQIDRAFELFDSREAIDILIGPPMQVISDCIRGHVIGEDLIVSDWSNIEGRVLAWLAGEAWKIKAFADFDNGIGADLYLRSYASSFNIPVQRVTKDQRQIGKVTELSMGYQGGVRAFHSMAKNYGVTVSDKRADEIKNAWRKAHQLIVKFWYDIEAAAIKAVINPGRVFQVRSIMFMREGDFLMCRLPSGRKIYYPYPEIKNVTTPWGSKDALTYLSEDSITKKWTRQKTYGGKLVENITQGVARDILAEALVRLDDQGHAIVGHVHDEIIVEGNASVKEIEDIMCDLPEWAEGLPLAAEGYKAKRYRK